MPENDKSILIPIVINNEISATYTYKNHGFTIELPNGFTPQEIQSEGGPSISIMLPRGILVYVTNADFWEKNDHTNFTYLEDKKIGDTTWKVYEYKGAYDMGTFYWFRQGNVGYEFNGGDISQLDTFKFVGWK